MMPMEFHKLKTHLKALDADSRILRFGHQVTDEIIDTLCDGFKKQYYQHTFFVIEDEDLQFLAVGHVATEHNMELAFSVLKTHQGKGMGDALMRRCIQHCRIIGRLKGYMVCLTTNAAIRHLCRKNGIKLTSEMGETLADIELDHPDVQTYIKESIDINLGAWNYVRKWFSRPFARLK
jgi:GNAT superfamily N-acetyltransferase